MTANKERPREGDIVKKIRETIEREKEKAERKKLQFTAPTDDQLRRKLGKIDSPMIIFQSWPDAPAGGSVNYNVGIHNPDAFTRIWLIVHVFVGPANPVPDPGSALQAVDPRFPRLSQPDFPGLTLAAGDTQTLSFQVAVPATIEPSEYLGNAFLFQADWHDVGSYLDRGFFLFTVT